MMYFLKTRQMGNLEVNVWHDEENYRAQIDNFNMMAEGPLEAGEDEIVYQLVHVYCLMFRYYPPECLFN